MMTTMIKFVKVLSVASGVVKKFNFAFHAAKFITKIFITKRKEPGA